MKRTFTPEETENFNQFQKGWKDGLQWANALMEGAVFNGTHGQAKINSSHDYYISAFSSAAYSVVKTFRGIWVDNNGVITKLLKA